MGHTVNIYNNNLYYINRMTTMKADLDATDDDVAPPLKVFAILIRRDRNGMCR